VRKLACRVFKIAIPSQNKNKKRECVPTRHAVGGNGQAIPQRKENDHPRSQTNNNAIARVETSKPTKDARHRLVASVKRFDIQVQPPFRLRQAAMSTTRAFLVSRRVLNFAFPMSSKSKQPGVPLNFESAMDRLEAIVEQMETGKLPLEDLIIRYEEGMNLVKICQERLASAEQKIEIIARNSVGKPVVKDFEPAAEAKIDNQAGPDERGEQANEVRLF
jgi:exodeoxyribonuclease VII small subunit